MKRIFMVLLMVLFLLTVVSCNDVNDTVTNGAADGLKFLFFDIGGDSVKPEPIATAKAVKNKTECIYMGLVVECK